LTELRRSTKTVSFWGHRVYRYVENCLILTFKR